MSNWPLSINSCVVQLEEKAEGILYCYLTFNGTTTITAITRKKLLLKSFSSRADWKGVFDAFSIVPNEPIRIETGFSCTTPTEMVFKLITYTRASSYRFLALSAEALKLPAFPLRCHCSADHRHLWLCSKRVTLLPYASMTSHRYLKDTRGDILVQSIEDDPEPSGSSIVFNNFVQLRNFLFKDLRGVYCLA